MKAHANLAEYELTTDDCHFMRKNFQYPNFDEYTYPSADLQLAAESIDVRGPRRISMDSCANCILLLLFCTTGSIGVAPTKRP